MLPERRTAAGRRLRRCEEETNERPECTSAPAPVIALVLEEFMTDENIANVVPDPILIADAVPEVNCPLEIVLVAVVPAVVTQVVFVTEIITLLKLIAPVLLVVNGILNPESVAFINVELDVLAVVEPPELVIVVPRNPMAPALEQLNKEMPVVPMLPKQF